MTLRIPALMTCSSCSQYLEDCQCCAECGNEDGHGLGCPKAATDTGPWPRRQTNSMIVPTSKAKASNR